MPSITLEFSEEHLQRLQRMALDQGMTVAEYLEDRLRKWLMEDRQTFAQALEYVLTKNAELYRRLA
ncbi:DNA-binding protein [Tuwongella immobilis]|uniref:Ribbon-helix-helix protein CopG domain-containing protein n=1 Tax=Tuwongella immobilis TaxID=692036 RepID=A0A6C2YUM2_9BACT|nr:DNA-binding protein [Tuwongella immobilis]VIP04853.1 Ribbon-helix-helix protein, copG family OS=Cylindrospermum stagnale PCC 7417 GN=Cylst_5927 PE=4 SV=1: RHH_1 [Tuwongella immobilis]VTS07066.1 Ribbon-helix-helix protein, copG family OS=Cylindrospermum stagnale PCC 7417 GN=Cylst_5927 PE=4 SV=1: RHH_1 [Tuwongella immobilis]